MDDFEVQMLEIYDATSTAFVAALLCVTIPIACGAYWRLLRAAQFRHNYSIRMVVLNGAAELINCLLFTITHQLTTFPFAFAFYAFLQRNDIGWILCSFWAFFANLALHSRFYVAITRLSALIPAVFRRINSPVIFVICAVTSIAGTVPAILETRVLSRFSYVVVFLGDTAVHIPQTKNSVEIVSNLINGHAVLMSFLTLLANLLLSLTLFRKGLMITSVVSYLFYMVYFVNSYLAREFDWAWSAYSQYLFLGLSSTSPFWCLIIFSGSIRATVLKRRTTVETRTAIHTVTVHHN